MIKRFTDFIAFKEFATKEGVNEDLEELNELDISFFREYKKYAILLLKAPGLKTIAILKNKMAIIYYPKRINIDKQWYKEIKNRKNAENTLVVYTLLDECLENIESAFQNLKLRFNKHIKIREIDEMAHNVRTLIDMLEAFLRAALRIHRTKSKFINIKAIEYDFDVLFTDARYLLERMVVLKKDLANARTRYELEISKELNINVAKLTEIMLILTIIGLVLSVPNTVATIFGVSTLAEMVPAGTVIDLIILSTIVSSLLSIWYIKKQSKYLIKNH